MFSRFAVGRELVEAAAPGPEVGGLAGEGGERVVGQPEEEWVGNLLAEEFAVEVERGEKRRVSLSRGDGALKAVDEDCELGLARRGCFARRRARVVGRRGIFSWRRGFFMCGVFLREAFAEDGQEV